MSKKATSKHFEEYGLRIQLIKHGVKVPHARLTSELCKKSKDTLLSILKDYAAGKAPKLVSKTDIAEWIERVETLARGPHPDSKLTSTKKEDFIEALGLKTIASRAKGDSVGKEVLRKRPGHKKAPLPTGDKAISQPNTCQSEFEANIDSTSDTPITTTLTITNQTQNPIEPTDKPTVVTQKANKRKYDSESAPTETEQTPPQKTKTAHAASPNATPSPQMSVADISQATATVQEHSEQVRQDRKASPDRDNVLSQALQGQIHDPPQQAIDLSLKKKKRDPTEIIHLQDEDLVVTHIPLETYVFTEDYNTGQRIYNLETVDGRTYTTKTDRITFFTTVPHRYDADSCPKHPNEEKPFREAGVHGRRGDFTDDPSLRSGRGHQVEPEDAERKRAYEAKYLALRRQWPYDKRRGMFLMPEHIEEKEDLNELER
ncbi:hypothetical protein SLS59_002868 [Nothophoma quercina]|uniref:Uncharacterized protein n=1 Tax=Nothophoma quercina TaxID=749835 RepID=A0ABR3RRV2_9PLEO